MRWNRDNETVYIYDNPPGPRHFGKYQVSGRDLYWSAEGVVAHFTYVADGGSYIRMSLPNALTALFHREVQRVARHLGVPFYIAPVEVIERAGIRASSVEILDIQRRAPYARPLHSLIRADVKEPYTGKHRTAYFLAGYDTQERNSYFFCEVIGEPTTIEQAYQALKPESVRIAEAQRRKVYRQGDMFFIRATKDEGPLNHTSGRMDRRLGHQLFGTNHYVDDLADNGGVTLVRGRVRHRPVARRPDHKPLVLPGGWWVAVQNAVPEVGKNVSRWR